MTNTTRCEQGRVAVTGQATIESAGDLLGVLREAMQHGGSVVIDTTEMTRADLTFIQLLVSSERTARENGVTLTLVGDRDLIRRAGGDSAELEALLDAMQATPSTRDGK